MSDLVSHVLAAIEAKERLAREATPGPWHVPDIEEPHIRCGGHYVEFVARDGERCAYSPDVTFHPDGGGPQWSIGLDDALFVVDNDPAAVLRRCRADAALVALHRPVVDAGVNSAWPPPGHCAVCWLGDDYEPFPCPTMRTLGLGYGISVEEETTGE